MLHASTNHGINGTTRNITVKATSTNQKDDSDADLQIARPLARHQPKLQVPLHEERVGKKWTKGMETAIR